MELKVHDQELRLQKLWKTKALIKRSLRTVDGSSIVVLYAGRLNLDAGPDFRDAVIKMNGKILRGDIEVHLASSGWWQHGHDKDPAYNNVILHLISEEGDSPGIIRREDGVEVAEVNLKAQIDEEEETQQKDGRHAADRIVENCPLSKEPEDRIELAIIRASECRLQNKVEQVAEQVNDETWDQVIYARILEALGYSKNQSPFRRLANLVPYNQLVAEMQWVDNEMAEKKCAALLFGAAGLLPSQSKEMTNIHDTLFTPQYIDALEDLWEHLSHQMGLKPMMAHEWIFFRLRPMNFPTRRLAGMVQLMLRFHYFGFLTGFIKIVNSGQKSVYKLANELERNLFVANGGDNNPGQKDAALIGKHRAREIAVNIVLPTIYLYCRETDDGLIANKIKELYFKFPTLSPNSISRRMTAQLFKESTSRNRFAFRQQGMIYLNNNLCKALRCDECLERISKG